MRFFYHTGIALYVLAIKCAALFTTKAKLWVDGRKNSWQKLAGIKPYEGKTVWVHCASLGEFEQGRPVIEAIKKQFPVTRIILTFYSPSGYEIRKNYALADYIFYLPADLPGVASRFYDSVKPDMGIIVKYEFWQGYLHEAKNRQIPLYLISGIFRKDMLFFKSYGNYFRKGLQAFHHVFVQDENSNELLQSIGIKNITVCGDTRLDRVLEAVNSRKEISGIQAFKNNQMLWICGSTWPADDVMILETVKKLKGRLKTLIVPHDIHPDYINTLISKNSGLKISKFSEMEKQNITNSDVLLLDTIGQLMNAYAYADFVYVGGGFGKAVHNTMEPSAYGVPIVVGPNHKKFKEIGDLIQQGAAICIHSAREMETTINDLLYTHEKRELMGNSARNYVMENAGATAVILQKISPLLN